MERIALGTPDLTEENIQKLGELFPQVLTEVQDEAGGVRRAVDFDALRDLLGDVAEGQRERYQFTWPGKREAKAEARRPIGKTLRPCPEESVDWDTTENLYIEGDNLDALKILKETYAGKVKMIYIDPPYNTGHDFVYRDRFAKARDEYDAESGDYSEEGRLVANPESNGRFHSDWCSMMYPRLMLARDLLASDGVIFISIDDNEQCNLKKICDNLFGVGNLVAELVWQQGRKSMASQIAINHEYCLVYCKDKAASVLYDSLHANHNWARKKEGLESIYREYDRLASLYGSNYDEIRRGMAVFYRSLPVGDPAKSQSQYKCADSRGLYFPGDIAQGTGNGGRFDIIHPTTNKPCKVPKGGWRFGESKLPEMLIEGRIHFGDDETTVPCLKRYLKETEYEVAQSVFYRDGRGASKRLERLFGATVFGFPKDEGVIKDFLSFATSYEEDENGHIVLDFFSGSATTAHAVMQLNAEDGGNRKCILVQFPETTDPKSEAAKAGYPNICEIGKERIRRAGANIKAEVEEANKQLKLGEAPKKVPDIGFRALKIEPSNFKDVSATPDDTSQQMLFDFQDNVKDGRSDMDLLFEVLPKFRIPFSARIEELTICDKRCFKVEDGQLIACFDVNVGADVIEAIAKMEPIYAVIRDASLADDATHANFEELFKTYSPDTVRCVI